MQKADFSLRPYRPGDAPVLARLFYETVHAVNIRDYSPAQVDAWATGQVEVERRGVQLPNFVMEKPGK